MNSKLCGLRGRQHRWDEVEGWKSYHGRTEDNQRVTIPRKARSGRDDSTAMKG